MDGKEEIEKKAKIEAEADLKKSIQQLVIDFNIVAEDLRGKRHLIWQPEEIILTILDAQKRIVAMMAQVAMKHEKVSVQTMNLTERIIKLTYSLIGIAVVSIIVAVIALFRS